MNRRSILALFYFFFVLGFSGASAQTATESSLKARMADRLKAVDALRASGKAGENNQGLLAPRTKLDAKEQALLEAENADRKEVYALIAKKTGEAAGVVAQKRAATLRKLSKPGVWLQDTKGEWYRKQ